MLADYRCLWLASWLELLATRISLFQPEFYQATKIARFQGFEDCNATRVFKA